jgi:glycosyltransferase involved in cell wall biosynthesis
MKKFLILSEIYPIPENTGMHKRTMLFARYFRKYGDVDIIYSKKTSDENLDNDIFRKEICIERENKNYSRYDEIKYLLLGYPKCIQARISKSFESELSNIIEKERYHFILIRYVFLAQYFFSASKYLKKKIVLDVDDIPSSDSVYNLIYSIRTKYKLKQSIDHKQLKRYEKKCYQSFGKILFSSSKDVMSINHKNNIYVVPNVIEKKHFSNYDFGDGFQCEDTLLFVGGLNYAPNIEGLRWFIDKIFIKMKQKIKGLKLVVVGKQPDERIVNICKKTEGIALNPNVPDVRPYYAKSKIAIVPLMHGGGTRIKIIESAFAGRPVISTLTGVYGLDFEIDREILVFHDLESFKKKYELLNDRMFYASVVKAAKEKACSNYSIENFERQLDEVCCFGSA